MLYSSSGREMRALTPPTSQTGIPPDDQLLFASGKQLTGKKETLAVCACCPAHILPRARKLTQFDLVSRSRSVPGRQGG